MFHGISDPPSSLTYPHEAEELRHGHTTNRRLVGGSVWLVFTSLSWILCASHRTLTLFLEHRHRPACAERKDVKCDGTRLARLKLSCRVRSFWFAESQAQCNPRIKSTTKPLCFKMSHALYYFSSTLNLQPIDLNHHEHCRWTSTVVPPSCSDLCR